MRAPDLRRRRPPSFARVRATMPGCAAVALVLALAAPAAAEPSPARPHGQVPRVKMPASATLEECVSSASQGARAVTFAGEMTALPGTARMEMRVDVLERAPEESGYHRVAAPGLGVWRASSPGVKAYRYLKQVTNLTAPAFYRGAIRFRWLNSHGHPIGSAELRTRACDQTPLVTPARSAGR